MSHLRDLPSPFRVEVLPEAGSTNALVADRARDGEPEGLVLVTEHQTAGRGRLDRVWTTPPRAALTGSFLLRPPGTVRPERWPLLPLLTALAVGDAVRAAGGPSTGLKWPNDVLHDGLKLAGILLERVDTPTGPGAVVGIGLNVSTTRDELPVPTAASLVTAGMVDPDRTAVLRAIVTSLAQRYDAWSRSADDSGLLADYRSRCDTVGRDVRVGLPHGDPLVGRAVGVADDGALLVRPGGAGDPVAVHAGDVVHVRPVP
jgi:BirA family biotin operon repressor/biotin-[acetyl-CoA-carboxylase] ligase